MFYEFHIRLLTYIEQNTKKTGLLHAMQVFIHYPVFVLFFLRSCRVWRMENQLLSKKKGYFRFQIGSNEVR